VQLSEIANWRQPREGDCLPACTAMVMAHLGEQVDYERLRQRLGTTTTGTPFSHLERLRSWRFAVELGRGDLAQLGQHVTAGRPMIVAVATELLPYWLTRPDIDEAARMTEHAVVVVGLDDQTVYVNDPDFDAAPQVVALGWFVDSWQSQNGNYAIIQRRWRRRA